MHFYEWSIGEYAKKTQHLTNEEDLAYRRALDMYYDTEKPLQTDGLATLSRRLRVDQQALQNVLTEFFPDGVNKHAEEKIAAYYTYIDKQKANGKLGGRPKRTQAKPTDNPVLTQIEPSAKPLLTTNHLPLTTNQELLKSNPIVASDAGRPPCPHKEIIDLYHKVLPELSSVRVWHKKRASALLARWRENVDHQNIGFWERFFEYVKSIPFLTGKNDQGWQADLEWLVNQSNFTKVIEGKYVKP